MSANELIRVIRSCKENGVKDLAYRGLNLSFSLDSYQQLNDSEDPRVDSLITGKQEANDVIDRHNRMLEDPEGHEEEVVASFINEGADVHASHGPS